MVMGEAGVSAFLAEAAKPWRSAEEPKLPAVASG